MKIMKSFLAMIIAVLFSSVLTGQDSKLKNESLKVSGNCGMCKSRIESAAKSAGAATASWDAKTQLLAVSFDAGKTNHDAISKKVAASGHDAGKVKADDKTYNALPGCCKYQRDGAKKAGNSGHTDHSGHSHH